jgi:twitching motility protein PilT
MHSPSVVQAVERIVGTFDGPAQRQITLQLSNALQGIISQELLPSVERAQRVLAWELLLASGAVRSLLRENQLHQLENTMQTSGRDGMMLMDNCLRDHYTHCRISYDTYVSHARNPERIIRREG